jgi:hypothetical protein
MKTAPNTLKHALMVEDEPFFQTYFKDVFATLGPEWVMHFAQMGQQAEPFLKKALVHLLV